MSKYQCLICTKNFKQKSQLDYHKNRKNKCKPPANELPQNMAIKPQKMANEPQKMAIVSQKMAIMPQKSTNLTQNLPNPTQNSEIIKNEQIPSQTEVLVEKLSCEHCNKSFGRKDVLNRHRKQFCPVIKQQNKEKQDTFEKLLLLETKYKELEEEIKKKDKELEEKIKDKDTIIKTKDDLIKAKDDMFKNKETHYEQTIKKLTSENKILQTVTINNNNNSNNTININIVSHGDEKLLERQIGELMLMVAAKKGINIVDELINLVHFNPTFPEFQNIYLPDMKNNHMMVYNEKWILKNATIAIKELCDNKSSFIIDNINAIFKRLTIREQAILKSWLILMNDKTTDEYKEYYDILLDKIKYNLFNKKDMVIASKKKSIAA